MTILGALLSLAVIAGSFALTRQVRALNRTLQARRRLAQMARQPPPVDGLAPVASLPTRAFRVTPAAACAAASGLLTVLGVAACLVIVNSSDTPTADTPPSSRTVTNTITQDRWHEGATITQAAGGDITVVPRQGGGPTTVASTVGTTSAPPASSASRPARTRRPSDPSSRRESTPTRPTLGLSITTPSAPVSAPLNVNAP